MRSLRIAGTATLGAAPAAAEVTADGSRPNGEDEFENSKTEDEDVDDESFVDLKMHE